MASGQSKKRNKKSYHDKVTTPSMPKDPQEKPKREGNVFLPGQGGSHSAKVGKRAVRRITKDGTEKKRTRSDNYNMGTPRMPRAADTKGITKIGKY